MTNRKPVVCSFGHEVVAGSIYCWQCKGSERPVAELSVDHGQLLWATTTRVTGKREVAIMVYLDGVPVVVMDVIDTTRRPACVQLKVREPVRAESAAIEARVELRDIFRALVDGRERVEARRSE